MGILENTFWAGDQRDPANVSKDLCREDPSKAQVDDIPMPDQGAGRPQRASLLRPHSRCLSLHLPSQPSTQLLSLPKDGVWGLASFPTLCQKSSGCRHSFLVCLRMLSSCPCAYTGRKDALSRGVVLRTLHKK